MCHPFQKAFRFEYGSQLSLLFYVARLCLRSFADGVAGSADIV